MGSIKVVLLGLGTVGEGVYNSIVRSHQERLTKVLGKEVEIVGILVKNERNRPILETVKVTTKVEELLELPTIDFVFEAIVGIEPACSYIKLFLDRGCHVISANKELLAHKGEELIAYAMERNRFLTFEAAVAGGIPLLRTILQLLQVNGITELEGIMNGTSNFILSKMRVNHLDFTEVLQEAQALGYAEANPESDVSGRDAFYKLMILSSLIYHQQPKWEEVERVGIENVKAVDLLIGEEYGLRLRLIASLKKSLDGVKATVKPTFVSNGHPLYNVEGVDNGIVISTDLVGTLLLQGPGAGSKATASAMIEDLVHIQQQKIPSFESQRGSHQEVCAGQKDPLITLAIFQLSEKVEWNDVWREFNETGESTVVLGTSLKEYNGFTYGSVLYKGRLPRFEQSILYNTYPVSPKGLKGIEEKLLTPVNN